MSDFSVAAVFSNHCVLQRDKVISVFGSAGDGCKVSVELYDQKQSLLAKNKSRAKGGSWLVQLEPQKAQNDCSLIITCECSSCECADSSEGFKKIFTDVAIGEVWLAGGQSNMEFELQNCTEGSDELNPSKNPENPNVRFYYTNKIAWMDEKFFEAERNTCWQTWDSEWKKSWSAVGYFFAKKLASDLGVTVGVIGCNWGGTSASAWMNRETLETDADLKTYLDEQEEATKGKSIEQQCREYDEYEIKNNEWQQKCNELYASEPGIEWDEVQKRIGLCPWPGPKSCKNPYRPTGLYECMLKRIIPYTLKGVLWYQGESDDHKPHSYAKLFTRMIDVWRNEWNESNLPFVFVQLPEHRYKQDKDFKHWCLIREAQQKVHNTVKNAFMTCALDLGQYNDIHPKAKKVLGQRMEKVALSSVYNQCEEKAAYSPMLQSYYANEKSITLTFSNAEEGFIQKVDDEELNYYKEMEAAQNTPLPDDFTGFEIAGSDCIYYPAQFTFGKEKDRLNTITLSNPKVPEPLYARYAWYNYGPVTIYNKNGLPLAPFRTSIHDSLDSKAKTEHAKIQQIMTVG